MVTEPRLLSIDVGTSAAEAAVVDRFGREIAHGRSPVEWKSVASGAEIEPPRLVERAVRAAVRWLNVAEWIARELGGEEVSELSPASRTGFYDVVARGWWDEALELAGSPLDCCPSLSSPAPSPATCPPRRSRPQRALRLRSAAMTTSAPPSARRRGRRRDGLKLLAAMAEIAGPLRRLVVTGGWAEGEAAHAVKLRHLGPLAYVSTVYTAARGAALAAARAAQLEIVERAPLAGVAGQEES